jgi:hypothetical protein
MSWRLVSNQDRRFGAAPCYWRVPGPGGKHLLFTRAEVERAGVRAAANPEDLPPPKPARPPWWDRLWSWGFWG